jgi:hypothetical protein
MSTNGNGNGGRGPESEAELATDDMLRQMSAERDALFAEAERHFAEATRWQAEADRLHAAITFDRRVADFALQIRASVCCSDRAAQISRWRFPDRS